MELMRCYICGLTSQDQTKLKDHMRIDRNVKVENKVMTDKFGCSECKYRNRDMEDIKKHMISEHKKNEWNWGLQIRVKFECDECELEFKTKSTLILHIESNHKELIG